MASSIFYSQNLAAGQYVNWGTTSGTNGYGIRDNAGTIEFKNDAGAWAPIAASASSAGGWTKAGAVVSLSTGTDKIGSNLDPATDATYTIGSPTGPNQWLSGSFSQTFGVGPGQDFTAGNRYAYGDVQLFTDLAVTGDPGYVIGVDIQANLSTGGANATTTLNPYFAQASATVGHALAGVISHDNTLRLTMANAATVTEVDHIEHDMFLDGSGTITTLYGSFGARIFTGPVVGTFRDHWSEKPDLSGGSTIVNYYSYSGEDLATLTVSGVKHFINYADKFIVDSAGTVTANNYKSSDGSAGLDTTITTATLVGKTITVKDGLITGFA